MYMHLLIFGTAIAHLIFVLNVLLIKVAEAFFPSWAFVYQQDLNDLEMWDSDFLKQWQ